MHDALCATLNRGNICRQEVLCNTPNIRNYWMHHCSPLQTEESLNTWETVYYAKHARDSVCQTKQRECLNAWYTVCQTKQTESLNARDTACVPHWTDGITEFIITVYHTEQMELLNSWSLCTTLNRGNYWMHDHCVPNQTESISECMITYAKTCNLDGVIVWASIYHGSWTGMMRVCPQWILICTKCVSCRRDRCVCTCTGGATRMHCDWVYNEGVKTI